MDEFDNYLTRSDEILLAKKTSLELIVIFIVVAFCIFHWDFLKNLHF